MHCPVPARHDSPLFLPKEISREPGRQAGRGSPHLLTSNDRFILILTDAYLEPKERK